MATRIVLLRHGETDWNVSKRIQGQHDVPLNKLGVEQAKAVASTLSAVHFSAIYSSDLRRASDTASWFAQARDLPVLQTPQLRERNFGKFQGMDRGQILAKWPDEYARHVSRDMDFDFATGESLRRFQLRVISCFEELVEQHTGQRILVVSHAGVIDMLYRYTAGHGLDEPIDFKIANGSLSYLYCVENAWRFSVALI